MWEGKMMSEGDRRLVSEGVGEKRGSHCIELHSYNIVIHRMFEVSRPSESSVENEVNADDDRWALPEIRLLNILHLGDSQEMNMNLQVPVEKGVHPGTVGVMDRAGDFCCEGCY